MKTIILMKKNVKIAKFPKVLIPAKKKKICYEGKNGTYMMFESVFHKLISQYFLASIRNRNKIQIHDQIEF